MGLFNTARVDKMQTIKNCGEIIGKGLFSTCYENKTNRKKVILKSCDMVKEIMALGWFPNRQLFPKVKKIGCDGDHYVYEMKRYEKVRSLKNNLIPLHYNYYKTLREIYLMLGFCFDSNKNYNELHKNFSSIKDRYLRTAMIEALNACANAGPDVCFEISPRNVAVNNGKLILLDCFYIKNQAKNKD